MQKTTLPASKLFFYLGAILALSVLITSCSRKMTFNSSSVVPAAQGSVKLKSDKNNNTSVSVSVKDLAPANRLTPPRKAYVVWMETEDNGTKNIGQLKSSGGLISKRLKASLTTVTSFKPVRFFITAEDDASAYYPGPMVVLTTN